MSRVFEDFVQSLHEDAPATDFQKSKTYYHGTNNKKAAQSIIRNGIQPPDPSNKNGWLTPVAGRVYLAPTLAYAMIYAAGGNVFGSENSPEMLDRLTKDGDYGYVFVVEGDALTDIQPDEDNVGELLSYVLDPEGNNYMAKSHPKWKLAVSSRSLEWLRRLGMNHITDRWRAKIIDGEYSYWAKAGKKLIKKMMDSEKLQIIDLGANIAHQGAVKPKEVWRFNKAIDIPKLKEDGSNFFRVAKRVKRA